MTNWFLDTPIVRSTKEFLKQNETMGAKTGSIAKWKIDRARKKRKRK